MNLLPVDADSFRTDLFVISDNENPLPEIHQRKSFRTALRSFVYNDYIEDPGTGINSIVNTMQRHNPGRNCVPAFIKMSLSVLSMSVGMFPSSFAQSSHRLLPGHQVSFVTLLHPGKAKLPCFHRCKVCKVISDFFIKPFCVSLKAIKVCFQKIFKPGSALSPYPCFRQLIEAFRPEFCFIATGQVSSYVWSRFSKLTNQLPFFVYVFSFLAKLFCLFK